MRWTLALIGAAIAVTLEMLDPMPGPLRPDVTVALYFWTAFAGAVFMLLPVVLFDLVRTFYRVIVSSTGRPFRMTGTPPGPKTR
jgi:hypothetical protein